VVVALVVLAVVVVIVLVVVVRRRRGPDPVDSFRRQIDALSPEARRPTIDRGRADDTSSDESSEGGDADGS
jgi:hypothetical protein